MAAGKNNRSQLMVVFGEEVVGGEGEEGPGGEGEEGAGGEGEEGAGGEGEEGAGGDIGVFVCVGDAREERGISVGLMSSEVSGFEVDGVLVTFDISGYVSCSEGDGPEGDDGPSVSSNGSEGDGASVSAHGSDGDGASVSVNGSDGDGASVSVCGSDGDRVINGSDGEGPSVSVNGLEDDGASEVGSLVGTTGGGGLDVCEVTLDLGSLGDNKLVSDVLEREGCSGPSVGGTVLAEGGTGAGVGGGRTGRRVEGRGIGTRVGGGACTQEEFKFSQLFSSKLDHC